MPGLFDNLFAWRYLDLIKRVINDKNVSSAIEETKDQSGPYYLITIKMSKETKKFYVRERDWQVFKAEVSEDNQPAVWEYKDMKINQGIPDSVFTLNAPARTPVVNK